MKVIKTETFNVNFPSKEINQIWIILFFLLSSYCRIYFHIYFHIYVCVCVCVCARARTRAYMIKI